MVDYDLYLKNLTGKDEERALEAAAFLVNNADLTLFKMLVNKTDFLFSFVKNNVFKRIEKSVNKDNFSNIIKFFDIYSAEYDDLFASILSKHANQDLTDDIFELLDKGSLAQKTYAAKYFSLIPDTVSLELLSKYAFSDDEPLAYNSSEALGQMQDDISFDIALSMLGSEDDFERLKAVKFFTAYGRNYPLYDIITAMKSSKMPENIAGQIPYMVSLCEILNSNDLQSGLLILDNILSGLGEILPLSDIFQFELFEVSEILIEKNKNQNELSGMIAVILLKLLIKFKLFSENPEYIYDEDKDTKYEISSIYKLLQSAGNEFWNNQKHLIINQLGGNKEQILSALPVIVEFKLTEAVPFIKKLLNNSDEIVLCEALTALKELNSLNIENIQSVSDKIINPNIKAIIDNLKCN